MGRNKEKEDLIDELAIITTLADENPCGMPNSVLKAITIGIKVLIGSHIGEGASRERAARYFKRDVRTLTDWSHKYDDFPQARNNMSRGIYYDWLDLVRFKLNHKELWKED